MLSWLPFGAKKKAGSDAAEKKMLAEAGLVAPDSETLKTDLSSRVEVSVRCEELSRSAQTFIVAYSRWSFEEQWTELAMTELNDDKEGHRCPAFKKTFTVDFKVEVQHMIRFEVFRCKDTHSLSSDNLGVHKYVGSCEMAIVEMLIARGRGNGWLTKDLEVPLYNEHTVFPGRVAAWAEEDPTAKSTVLFNMLGRDIKSQDMWKWRADPYCIMNRSVTVDEEENLECVAVHRTEVVRRTKEPHFKRVSLTSMLLCNGKLQQDIVIECFDWYRTEKEKSIGEAVVTFEELHKAFREAKPLVRPICRRVGPRRAKGAAGRKGTNMSSGSGQGTKDTGFSRSNAGSKGGSKDKGTKESAGSGRGRSSKEKGEARGTKEKAGTKETAGPISPSSKGSKERVGSKEKVDAPRRSTKGSGFGDFAKRMMSSTKESRRSSGSGGSGLTSLSRLTGGSGASGKTTASQRSAKEKEFGPKMGELVFEEVGVERRFTFLDYIRGGLEMKLVFAIDFTRSNQAATVPDSLHFGTPSVASAYATTIRAIGAAMRHYDRDNMYAVYGFGAKIPPSNTICSDCFSLTGDFSDPEVEGVDGVIEAYQRALKIVRLHGPSHIHKVVKHVCDLARPYAEANANMENGVAMKWYTLVVLTDGDVHQQQKAIDELCGVERLPVYVVVIGVGSGGLDEFAFLKGLGPQVTQKNKELAATRPAEEETAAKSMAEVMAELDGGIKSKTAKKKIDTGIMTTGERDYYKFVSFDEYHGMTADLASAALAKLPHEVIVYYGNKKVKPRFLDKYEDEGGTPKPRTIPDHIAKLGQSQKRSGSNSRAASTLTSRSATNDRSSTKMSAMSAASGGTTKTSDTMMLQNPMYKAQKEQMKRLEKLPPFLRNHREHMIEEAERLGYEIYQINRALNDGVPDTTIESLVDNIMNAGYGKNPCYKMAARDTTVEEGFTLPNAPEERKTWAPRQETKKTTEEERRMTNLRGRSGTNTNSKSKEVSEIGSDGKTLSKNLQQRLTALASRSRGATKDTLASGISGKDGTPGLRSRDVTKELGDGTTGDRRISKGILKPASRGPTKDLLAKVRLEDADDDEGPRAAGDARTLVRFHGVPAPPQVGPSSGRPSGSPDVCKICMEGQVSTEFVPCGHRVACARCAGQLGALCPVCQATITDTEKFA